MKSKEHRVLQWGGRGDGRDRLSGMEGQMGQTSSLRNIPNWRYGEDYSKMFLILCFKQEDRVTLNDTTTLHENQTD